ncbi:MAG: hypothetical protein ACRCTZ_12445 [Sarcina sp.]
MGNYYKCAGNAMKFTSCQKTGYPKTSECQKVSNCGSYGCNQKPCGCDNYDECKSLEAEMKEMLECLMKLEECSSKKITKAREYQEQVEILLAKAMEAQCKANELLVEAECLEAEASELRKKTYQIVYRTIDCYKNEKSNSNSNGCCCCCKCNCNCNCNCCNKGC